MGGALVAKDTKDLEEELKSFSSFKSFYDANSNAIAECSLADYLQNIINKKGLNKAQIVEKSEMSEVYAYQILSGVRKQPKREKVLCLAFAMGLSFDETQTMLKKTGYPTLYAKNPFDCVVIYALCKHLGVVETNEILFEYGQETLG